MGGEAGRARGPDGVGPGAWGVGPDGHGEEAHEPITKADGSDGRGGSGGSGASLPRSTGPPGPASAAVDGRRPLRFPWWPTPAVHELSHDAHELGRLEGLGEKRVDAGGEPALDLVRSAGADDGDGHPTGLWIVPQPRGGPQPVEPRHDDVESDDIRTDLMHHIQTLGTIGRGHHLEPLELEIDPDQLTDHPVVIDNEHSPGHA